MELFIAAFVIDDDIEETAIFTHMKDAKEWGEMNRDALIDDLDATGERFTTEVGIDIQKFTVDVPDAVHKEEGDEYY